MLQCSLGNSQFLGNCTRCLGDTSRNDLIHSVFISTKDKKDLPILTRVRPCLYTPPWRRAARAAPALARSAGELQLCAAMPVQAVIMASCSDGENLYPLTEQMPSVLLPVANRHLLSFQLELLERAAGFKQVSVAPSTSSSTPP